MYFVISTEYQLPKPSLPLTALLAAHGAAHGADRGEKHQRDPRAGSSQSPADNVFKRATLLCFQNLAAGLRSSLKQEHEEGTAALLRWGWRGTLVLYHAHLHHHSTGPCLPAPCPVHATCVRKRRKIGIYNKTTNCWNRPSAARPTYQLRRCFYWLSMKLAFLNMGTPCDQAISFPRSCSRSVCMLKWGGL